MRTGFSLIEVLVALALLGILAVSSAVIFHGTLRSEELLNADRHALDTRDQNLILQFAGLRDESVITIRSE